MPHDLIHALRFLWRARTTIAIAVATLAVAVGFAVAVFSAADRVLFRPLPYPDAAQLVDLRLVGMRAGSLPLSARELLSARASSIFVAAEGFDLSGVVTWRDGPEPERVRLGHITPGLLSMLGARLVHGRPLEASDTAAAAEPVALLDHGFWQSRYGGDPGVVGRSIRFDEGPPLRVVGVLGRDFIFPTPAPRFRPQVLAAYRDPDLNEVGRGLSVIARLRPGLDPSVADRAIAVDPVPSGSPVSIAARPLQEALGGSARRGLSVLLIAALGLLLIAGLDVAGLLVARATTRDREIVVRRALGAGSWRIARQLLVEGAIVGGVSCGAGLLLASWLFDSVMALVPSDLQLIHPVGIDTRALVFALGVSASLMLLFGSAPLLHLRGAGASSLLRIGSTHTAGAAARRFASILVAVQIALALALLIGGGLMLSSFWKIRTIQVGLEAEGLAFVKTGLPPRASRHAATLYADMVGRLRELEGVTGAAALDAPLFELSYQPAMFRPLGRGTPAAGSGRVNDIQSAVTDGYFETMRIPVHEGRTFTAADLRDDAEPVAIVSAGLARRWWPGETAIGQQVSSPATKRTVIGVVGNVRQISPRMDAPGELYIPMTGTNAASTATLVIRSANERRALAQTTAVVRNMVPGIVVISAAPASDRLATASQRDRFYALLLGLVAAAGLCLAALGAYGMLDWSIGRRRREIGIRAALGATPGEVAAAISRQLAVPVTVGIAIGLLMGQWGSRLLSALLFEVQPGSLSVWMGAGLTLIAILSLAMGIPARRAAAISPAEALRTD